MTPEEQRNLLSEILYGIESKFCIAVGTGKIPEYWDGHEIRELLTQWTKEKVHDGPSQPMYKNGKRYRDFKNHCIVNGL